MAAPGPSAFPGGGGALSSLAGAKLRHARFILSSEAIQRDVGAEKLHLFPAELLATFTATGAPFNAMFGWHELFCETGTPPHGTLLNDQVHGRQDNDQDQAVNLCPPSVLLHYRIDQNGRAQYLVESAQTVHLARITQVNPGPGGFNATYRARTIDLSYTAITNLTPIDRWPGVPNYIAKTINSLCLILVESATLMHLVAFESPELNACPGGAAAAAPSPQQFALTAGI